MLVATSTAKTCWAALAAAHCRREVEVAQAHRELGLAVDLVAPVVARFLEHPLGRAVALAADWPVVRSMALQAAVLFMVALAEALADMTAAQQTVMAALEEFAELHRVAVARVVLALLLPLRQTKRRLALVEVAATQRPARAAQALALLAALHQAAVVAALERTPHTTLVQAVQAVPVCASFTHGRKNMNAHQLDADGVIINTIVVDSLDVLPDLVDASIGGTIGDSIIDGVVIPASIPVIVPQSVTNRQAKLALHAAGLLTSVTTAINAAGEAAKIEWEYAQTVDRDSGLVPQMAAALGMTEEQIDALFIAAGAL